MPSAVLAGGRSSNAGAALHGERHCKASRPQEVAASWISGPSRPVSTRANVRRWRTSTRFVPGRSRLRNQPRYHRHDRHLLLHRTEICLFLKEWAATSSVEDDVSGKRYSEIEFQRRRHVILRTRSRLIRRYGETGEALADLFDERGINNVSINV